MKALVTGGGRGIGAGIARALAADGWEVVVGARSREQVEAVADEIGGEWVQVDVANPESVDNAVAAATDTRPKLRYPAGTLARRVSKLRRYAPSNLFDRQIRKINQLAA